MKKFCYTGRIEEISEDDCIEADFCKYRHIFGSYPLLETCMDVFANYLCNTLKSVDDSPLCASSMTKICIACRNMITSLSPQPQQQHRYPTRTVQLCETRDSLLLEYNPNAIGAVLDIYGASFEIVVAHALDNSIRPIIPDFFISNIKEPSFKEGSIHVTFEIWDDNEDNTDKDEDDICIFTLILPETWCHNYPEFRSNKVYPSCTSALPAARFRDIFMRKVLDTMVEYNTVAHGIVPLDSLDKFVSGNWVPYVQGKTIVNSNIQKRLAMDEASILLDVYGVVGKASVHLNDLSKIDLNSIIELDKYAGDLIDVYINGKLIGKGELVAVNNRYGIKMKEVV